MTLNDTNNVKQTPKNMRCPKLSFVTRLSKIHRAAVAAAQTHALVVVSYDHTLWISRTLSAKNQNACRNRTEKQIAVALLPRRLFCRNAAQREKN